MNDAKDFEQLFESVDTNLNAKMDCLNQKSINFQTQQKR